MIAAADTQPPIRRIQMSDLRQQLIDAAIRVADRGLNNGTSGNLSVRSAEDGEAGFYITPTSTPYQDLKPDDIVFITLNGDYEGRHNNRRKPSTEWRFHLDIYNANPHAGAVLHAHSRFASSLSCLRRDIPAFHYMIALFGGDTLRCAEYSAGSRKPAASNTTIRPTRYFRTFRASFMASPSNHMDE